MKTLFITFSALLIGAVVTGCTATKEETTAEAAPIDEIVLVTDNKGMKSEEVIFLKTPAAKGTDAQTSDASVRRGWKVTEKKGSGNTRIVIFEPESTSVKAE